MIIPVSLSQCVRFYDFCIMFLQIPLYYLIINMSELKVEHWDSERDGPLNDENMTKKVEAQGYSCVKYTFPAGTASADHSHDVPRKDAILAGQFKFAIPGKEEVILQPGDILDIPVGLVHNESVFGNDAVTFIDATKL